MKLEVVVIVICEQAGIYSRIEREVFGGRIENDERLWRMRENKEEKNSRKFDVLRNERMFCFYK